nr:MAG TPA: hypothetical protein [Bacteriophage sp.]
MSARCQLLIDFALLSRNPTISFCIFNVLCA